MQRPMTGTTQQDQVVQLGLPTRRPEHHMMRMQMPRPLTPRRLTAPIPQEQRPDQRLVRSSPLAPQPQQRQLPRITRNPGRQHLPRHRPTPSLLQLCLRQRRTVIQMRMLHPIPRVNQNLRPRAPGPASRSRHAPCRPSPPPPAPHSTAPAATDPDDSPASPPNPAHRTRSPTRPECSAETLSRAGRSPPSSAVRARSYSARTAPARNRAPSNGDNVNDTDNDPSTFHFHRPHDSTGATSSPFSLCPRSI